MTCREFAAFLDDYLAGTMPAEQQDAFRRHLAVCKDCVAYLDGYRAAVESVQRLRGDDAPVPETVPEDVVQAILRSRKPRA